MGGESRGGDYLSVLANLKFASSEYKDLKSDKNGHNLFLSLRGIIALQMLILTAAEFQIRLNGGNYMLKEKETNYPN